MLHNTLKTFVAAIVLMGRSICCTRAFAQISDAQIWDVQTANDYSGGHYENDGFFFGAEGLYWALPGPKSGLVGNENAEGATAYNRDWSVRNDSSQWFVVNQVVDDEDKEEEKGHIIDPEGNEATVKDAIAYGYVITGDENFKDLTADTYGPPSRITMTTQHNSWNTNLLETQFHVGQRYNFGFMNGHNGWECQVFTITGNNKHEGSNVQLGLNDTITAPDGYGNNYLKGVCQFISNIDDTWHDCHVDGNTLYVDRMLVQFDKAEMWDEINTWGVELNYLRRAHATRIGMFELGLGVRYMKWNEEFGFWGGSDHSGNGEIYTPNFLDDTTIRTEADNNLVGPQLGLRWSRNTARFGMEILAKFTAAYNAQKITNSSILGSNGYDNGIWGRDGYNGDPWDTSFTDADEDGHSHYLLSYAPNIGASGISGYHKDSFGTFTPVAELGVKFKFDLTSKINLHVGWSGIYAGNIARPGGMTDYSLDNTTNGGVLGIKEDGDHRKNVFIHGFTFGITLNR